MNEANEHRKEAGQEGRQSQEGVEASTVEQKAAAEGAGANDQRQEEFADRVAAEPAWPADDAPTIISKAPSSGSGSPNRNEAAVNVRGRRLAHYELEEPIGVGGMAAVIRARDTQLDRTVALKILPPESASDPDQVRRFEQEARAAARLDHENIARVYYCGEDQGLHFIVFEYIEGENLRDMIARRGRIPVQEATDYVLQVARGLAHAADRGVVHRDIKPSNIIITASGVAKLVDMGLARTVGPSAGELTHSGVTLGTFDYISPEQALDPRLADTRSDMYSLGCTFYHMLTGRPPAPEGTAARKLRFHQSERPVDPRYYNPAIPRELVVILGRMLAKDPQQRYQHPRELIADLELVLQQWRQKPGLVASSEALHRLSSQRWRGRVAVVLAIAALCAIATVAWLEALGPAVPADTSSSSVAEAPPAVDNTGTPPATGPVEPPSSSASAAPQVFQAKTASELRQAFAEVGRSGQSAVVYLDQMEYDLANLQVSGGTVLSLNAGQVVVEPPGRDRPTLRFDLSAVEVPEGGLRLLEVQGGIVTLRRVRVVVQLSPANEPAALVRLGQGQVFLQDCEIVVESALPQPQGRVFHIVSEGPGQARLHLQQCVLISSVPLLVMEGPADVVLEDCALHTTSAAMVVRGRRASAEELGEAAAGGSPRETRAGPRVSLTHCSWWLDSGPVILMPAGSALELSLRQCVLAKVRGDQPTTMAALYEEPANASPELNLELENCVVYRVEPFIVRALEGEGSEVLLPELRSWRGNNVVVSETGCWRLAVPPWAAEEPVKALEQGRYPEAFRVRADAQELRRRDQQDVVLGVRKLLGEPLYPNLPTQLISLTRAGVRELIVDGTGGKPDTFDTLSSAMNSSAAEGESRLLITLRVNGPLPIRSLLDIAGNRHITIRAAEGFRPELIFHPDRVPESNAITSLFRVHDGQLVLEQVGFRLTPLAAGNVRWQAVINLTGSGSCTLRQCYVSCIAGEGEPQLACVALTDPTGTMVPQAGKPSRAGEPPHIVLENCFLRGRGVGVYVSESRPMRLSLHNLLAVLDEPLLRVEASRTEMSVLAGGEMVCSLDRVSVCSTEPIVQLVAVKENAQPVPVRWQATSSLFVVAASMEQPLLRIEGPQTEQDLRRSWFSWSGQADRPNVCSVNGPALTWRPLGQEAMMSVLAAERTEWSNFWGTNSEEIRFVRQWRWAGYRPGEKPSWEAQPQEFHIPAGLLPASLSQVGAELMRLPLYQTPSSTPTPQ